MARVALQAAAIIFNPTPRIKVRVDFAALVTAFNAWAAETFPTLVTEHIATAITYSQRLTLSNTAL